MLYGYVIVRDYGFAPNPFYGICTLATCKPKIRDNANVGDWIAAYGGQYTPVCGKLVYLMKVEKTMTYDEYWACKDFDCKKPCFNKSLKCCYGDNVYHTEAGQWVQENSHHSYENGINYNNLNHDTQTDRVLLSHNFWYFGENAIQLPDELNYLVCKNRGHKKFCKHDYSDLIAWIEANYTIGKHGNPFDWNKGKSFVRFQGEKT